MMRTSQSRTKQRLLALGLGLIFVFARVGEVVAAPYFHIVGNTYAVTGARKNLDVYLATDGSTLTAIQVVVNFDNGYLTKDSLGTLSSRCSFWAPADPSLGYGSSSTPYFYGTNKAVLSCGFSNPGYTSSTATGAKIATLSFVPTASGSTTLSFSDVLLRYIGTTVNPGTSSSFDLTVYQSTESANAANPSPTPIPTPGSGSSGSNSSGTTVISDPSDTLDVSDLNFVEVEGGSGSSNSLSTTGEDSPLQIIDLDDTIPGAPLMTPRPRPTAFVFNASSSAQAQDEAGQVLSVQSLRELLIPGKSEADRTVVMFNLITTLAFLVLLGIAVWRMMSVSRMNRLRYQHMTELLTGELSAIESKMVGMENTTTTGQDLKKSFEELISSVSDKPKQ